MIKDDYQKYAIGFRNGTNEARFADEPEKIVIPEVDNSDFESIGYADGIDYGKYLVIAGLRYAIKEENLIAVIDKSFNRACENKEKSKIKKCK